MASCTVTSSPDIARRAAKTFFWRKFRTPVGVLFALSPPIVLAFSVFLYFYEGANWAVGAFGTLFTFNVIIQASYYFTLPRALAKRLSDPAKRSISVETSREGVRLSYGPNAALLPWKRYKFVWLYPDFIILSVQPAFSAFVIVPTDGMTSDVHRAFEAAARGEAVT